jgi:GNAT superfamily N-acetyltransferase
VTTPTIRPATIADLAALVRLRIALMREMGALDTEDGTEATELAEAMRRYIAAELPAGGFLAWVGVDDGDQVIACGGLVFLQKPPSPQNQSGREAYIMNMYTVPPWRGRGVASRLFAAIVAQAREAGVRLIRLHTTADGRAVYERAGFRIVDNEMALRLPD